MRITGTGTQSSVINMRGNELLRAADKDKARMKQLAYEREMKIRENENKRLEKLQAQIVKVADSQLSQELKDAKIEGISLQIEAIYKNRAEREVLAAEREMEERKKEQEEKIREQEKANAKMKANAPDADSETALRKEDVSGMVKMAVSADGIRKLEQTKALRQAEATRLKQDIENDTGLIQIGHDVTLKVQMKVGDFPNSFRERNLAKLNEGILNLESAVNNEIGRMNRTAENWAEDKEDIVRDVKEDEREEEDENNKVKKADEENSEENDGGENTDGVKPVITSTQPE